MISADLAFALMPALIARPWSSLRESASSDTSLPTALSPAALEKAAEERNAKVNARAFAAPKTRTGRQVMFRSAPVRRQIKEEVAEPNQDELDEMRFLSGD